MNKILLVIFLLLSSCATQSALPPTRSAEQGDNLSVQFSWLYKKNFLEEITSTLKLVDTDNVRLLSNSNFENPSVASGWTFTGTSTAPVAETVEVLDGLQSIEVASTAQNFELSQTVSVDKFDGSLVGIKAWVKADHSVDVCFMQGTDEGSCQPYDGTNQWQEVTTFGNVTAGTAIGIKFKSIGNVTGTAYFDFVRTVVNPLVPTNIFASTEWVDAGPITIDATTTAPTKPTTTIADSVRWRRVGDTMEAVYIFHATNHTGAAAGLGDYIFRLPDGYEMDTNKVTFYTTVEGGGAWITGSGTTIGHGSLSDNINPSQFQAVAYDSTGFRLFGNFNGGTGVASSAYGNLNIADSLKVKISVPIQGWSDTANGVVVQNRTDSSDVENVFSAKVIDTIVSQENVDWINGNCSGTRSDFTCTFNSGMFTQPPNCWGSVLHASTNTYVIYPHNITSNSVDFRQQYANNVNGDQQVNIFCQRQGTDYIKETDKVYTVPVDSLTENKCIREDNDARSLTVSTESIPFDDVGKCVGWTSGADGSNLTNGNYYTVQKDNSEVLLSIGFHYNAISQPMATNVHINGTLYKRITTDTGSSSTNHFNGTLLIPRGVLNAGDIISFNVQRSITLITGVPSRHYLHLVERYGDRGVFLGTIPKDNRNIEEKIVGTWFGARMYERSYDVSISATSNVTTTLATVGPNLTPIKIEGVALSSSGNWENMDSFHASSSCGYVGFGYDVSTGNLNFRPCGDNFTRQRFTFRYTK